MRPPEQHGVERGPCPGRGSRGSRRPSRLRTRGRREDQPADLGGSQGDRVARQAPRGQPGLAVLVDPAVEGRDEVLPAPRGVVGREHEPRPSSARWRREDVRGLHGEPEVVLVVLVEVDVSGDLDRSGQGDRPRPGVGAAGEQVRAGSCGTARTPSPARRRGPPGSGAGRAARRASPPRGGRASGRPRPRRGRWGRTRRSGTGRPRPEKASTVARTDARA